MVSVIKATFDKMVALADENCELYRTGKVASYLCFIEPGQFEPESSHELHFDIEYYYKLYIAGDQRSGLTPQWQIEIYTYNWSDSSEQIDRLKLIIPRISLGDLVGEDGKLIERLQKIFC